MDDLDLLIKRERQFLVHSFLYYKLDSNLIEDGLFDHIAIQMGELIEKYPVEAVVTPYFDLCRPSGKTGSGFYIVKYPPEIINRALHLFYYHEVQINHLRLDFKDFVQKFGYCLGG